jgi:NYN domain
MATTHWRSRRLPGTAAFRRGRRLVLVDIENMAGGACLTAQPVLRVKQRLGELLSLGVHDQVVIGTSHIGLVEVGCNWQGARRVVRSGPNGADLALLDVLDERISDRFEEVVLASGDGIFACAVATLATRGVPTTVVGRCRGTVAKTLQLAASRVVYLYDLGPMSGEPNVA